MFRLVTVWILLFAIAGQRTLFVCAGDVSEEQRVDDTTKNVEDDDGKANSVESRNDLPDLSDEVLRSFFDFVDDDDKEKPSKPTIDKLQYPVKKSLHHSHYNHANVPPSPHLVAPGSHYKEGVHRPRRAGTKETFPSDRKSVVVGPYQVSVVDATSPLLSSLGLKRHHLEKLAGSPLSHLRDNSTDLSGSASSQSSSYAEYPKSYQSAPSYASYQKAPPSYGPGHDNNGPYHHHHHHHPPPPPPAPYSSGGPSGSYAHPPRPHVDYPPPQRSYPPEPAASSGYKYPYSSSSSGYPPPPPSSGDSYHGYSGDSWKPSAQTEYASKDHYDDHERNNPNYNRALWKQPGHLYPPHPPYKVPETQDLNPTYKPQTKPALGVLSPTYSKPESSYSKPGYSSSSDHYSSSGYSYSSSKPSKTPSRAGSLSHDSYQGHSSKPGISISFKAKAPGHGLSIPLNFNPLEVVKKIALPLTALNPLANKKVTIGITIENKDGHVSHY